MTLEEAFETITDARIERCKKHNLVDILMIVFVGILCGYKSIEHWKTAYRVATQFCEYWHGLTQSSWKKYS